MFVKSRGEEDHLKDLEETFSTLHSYNMKLNPIKCAFRVTTRKFLGFMVSQRGIEANPDKIRAIVEKCERSAEFKQQSSRPEQVRIKSNR